MLRKFIRGIARHLVAAATCALLVVSDRAGLATTPQPDLSVQLIESAMRARPDARELGKWGYTPALFLYAQYLVYQRTHDPRYLAYIRTWADAHVDTQGHIDNSINALDYMLPGNLMLALYRETEDVRYKTAATTIRRRLDTYPRTADGGLWHATSRQHQLWLDGTYMSLPFLVRYGAAFGDEEPSRREAAKQLLIYASHLQDPKTGLFFHAYDESGAQPWAQANTYHSSIFWGRSIGWYAMTLVDVLQTMPVNDPDRPKLIALTRSLAEALARYQDAKTGLWYNVVDRADLPQNWLETSASAMYTYMLWKASTAGYIPRRFGKVACRGYAGVLTELSRDAAGNVHLANICEGTNVSDLSYYLARKRPLDDLHGLGAFLLMNGAMRGSACEKKAARAWAKEQRLAGATP